jgi:hypothetical protein
VKVSAVGDRVANVDADTELDTAVGLLIGSIRWQLLLDLHGATHRAVDAVEHHKQRIACGIDDPATMLGDGWIDQVAAQRPQSLQRAGIIQADEAAVTHNVGVHHGNQLPTVCSSF